MRSVMLLGGLALGVALLVVNGYLPRRARAVESPPETTPNQMSRLEVRYADFEDEAALLAQRRGDAHPGTPTPAQAEPPGHTARAASPEDRLARRPADTPPASSEDSPPTNATPRPVADAGTDRTLWAGYDELTLDGSNSTGDGLSYSWKQVSGPLELHIRDRGAVKTTAAGLARDADAKWGNSEYEFELTATDAQGRRATDTVRFVVKTAPPLSLRPNSRRRLAFRDGYLLAHLEAWKSGRTGYSESFELRSPAELFIHQFGGDGDYEISATSSGDTHVYQITVHPRDGQPTTWLEFFVDTPERVPALVQLGVNWE